MYLSVIFHVFNRVVLRTYIGVRGMPERDMESLGMMGMGLET